MTDKDSSAAGSKPMTPFVHTRPAVNELKTEIDDNTIPYHQYLLDTEAQNVPTEVSADTSDKVSMIAILTDLQTQLDGHAKRNMRNAELVQENDLLKSTLSGKEKSIAFLQSEKEKILSEKKDLADSYLDEIKPKAATADLHKDLLGTRNPGLGYIAKRAQPVLYDADTLLHPAHHPVRIWDKGTVPRTGVGLSANEIASNASNPATPVTPFVHNRPPPSQVLFHLQKFECLSYDLRSACDREHTKVLELEAEVLKQQKMVIESEKRNSHLQKTHIDLQLKFQNYKQCIDTSSASNAIFEINKLRKQLQGKDDTIRNLDAQINIMKVLNVGSTVVRIQNDGFKAENVNLKRHYEELSKSNAYSRSTFTTKINALTAENAILKTELSGKKSSGSTASEKPKVLASGMYTNSSKYVPPPKRANWVKPTPLPKKKQVTFQEPPRTSNRPTQKPPVQQNKKPNVPVNLSTRTKPATESRKPMPKSHTRNHHILPNKSVNARRAADHNRKLNVVDHNQFVIRSLKSVNTKTPQAKHSVNHTKQVWKATRNHNVNTTKTAWRPTRKVVGSVKPQWKPTGRHFALYDNCPLTRIMEPIVEPLELTPSVSSSSKVTMISRFTDCKLSDRKAGSKGLSGIF
ncbi:hypothetical protein Tco_0317590 [Tanacetum coccineum]